MKKDLKINFYQKKKNINLIGFWLKIHMKIKNFKSQKNKEKLKVFKKEIKLYYKLKEKRLKNSYILNKMKIWRIDFKLKKI